MFSVRAVLMISPKSIFDHNLAFSKCGQSPTLAKVQPDFWFRSSFLNGVEIDETGIFYA